jgi:hypothetical protein
MELPTKRRTLARSRRATFTPEVLTLFAELNAVPARDRGKDEFKKRDRELARLLGLGGQWLCSVASVTDGRPLRPASMTPSTYADHVKVRVVRERLIAAIGEKTAPAVAGTDAV